MRMLLEASAGKLDEAKGLSGTWSAIVEVPAGKELRIEKGGKSYYSFHKRKDGKAGIALTGDFYNDKEPIKVWPNATKVGNPMIQAARKLGFKISIMKAEKRYEPGRDKEPTRG